MEINNSKSEVKNKYESKASGIAMSLVFLFIGEYYIGVNYKYWRCFYGEQ